jgi:hypothetical protein
MRRLAVIILSLVGAGAAWTAAASASLCWSIQRHDLFVWPFTQWWTLAPLWFGANWYATLLVVVSIALPTLVVGLALVAVAALTWGKSGRSSLYGQTGWASAKEMRRANISTSRRPF